MGLDGVQELTGASRPDLHASGDRHGQPVLGGGETCTRLLQREALAIAGQFQNPEAVHVADRDPRAVLGQTEPVDFVRP